MTTTLRHGVLRAATVLLAVLVLAISVAVLAGAATLSPTTAEAGTTTSFTVSVGGDGVDLVARVTTSLPAEVGYADCSAPDGWSCQGGGGAVTWQRSAALAPEAALGMVLVLPVEPGDLAFTTTEERTSGATATSTTIVTLVPPAEPTDEPTEEPSPSDEPSEEATPTPMPNRPAPPLEPFRPPSEDGPISIRDLPDDPEPSPSASSELVVEPTRRERNLGLFVLGPFAALLLISASGFLVAEHNR